MAKRFMLGLAAVLTFSVAAAERNAVPGTLQAELDAAGPGDVVVLAPGVYYGPFKLGRVGTPEAPITIRAERGTAILTGADRAIREGKVEWKLEDADLGLYSVPFSHNPVRVLYSGTDLMPFSSLDGLKRFTLLQDCPGPEHGFFYVAPEKKLYVRLHAGGKYGPADPNQHTMCVSPPATPGFNGEKMSLPEHANLMIMPKGPGHVVVDGLTFETPAGTGVLTNAGQVTVRNARFDGCRFGVYGVWGKPEELPDGVVVENCFYHHFPAFDDVAELLVKYGKTPVQQKYSIFWWHRKGDRYSDRDTMKNYETGIAGGIGRDWKIRRNLMSNVFEGLSTWGNSWSRGLEVSENIFENVVDNALEAENHAADMTVRNNVFKNVFEPISWQPLDGMPWPGPIYVHDNLFYSTPEFQALWPWRPGMFKIGASDRNWAKPHMGSIPDKEPRGRFSKRFAFSPGEGFLAFNNTILHPHGNFFNKPGPISRALVNFRFFNNVIAVAAFHKTPTYMGDLMEFYNNAVVSPGNAEQARHLAGDGGKVFSGVEALGLTAPDRFDFALAADSPLRGTGTMKITPKAHADPGAAPWTMPETYPLDPETAKKFGR